MAKITDCVWVRGKTPTTFYTKELGESEQIRGAERQASSYLPLMFFGEEVRCLGLAPGLAVAVSFLPGRNEPRWALDAAAGSSEVPLSYSGAI